MNVVDDSNRILSRREKRKLNTFKKKASELLLLCGMDPGDKIAELVKFEHAIGGQEDVGPSSSRQQGTCNIGIFGSLLHFPLLPFTPFRSV